jgi:hypothetical protein
LDEAAVRVDRVNPLAQEIALSLILLGVLALGLQHQKIL